MAHELGIQEFGMFAIASSVYALITGVVRAAVIEPLLAVGTLVGDLTAASRRASLVGLVASVPTIAAGALLQSPFLIAAGFAAHGLTMYELSRTVNMAAGDPSKALAQDVVWCCATVGIAVCVGTDVVDGAQGFGLWVGVGALIGYLACFRARYSISPRWPRSRVSTGTAVLFGSDFLVGSGSGAVTTNALGVFAGISTVAALRAAGTIFGPVLLVVSVARTLAIPFLQQFQRRSDGSEVRVAVKVTTILVLLAICPLVFLAFLPASIGSFILGQNWTTAEPLLPFLSLEVLLIVAAVIPFAGHRVYLAGRSTLVVRTGLGFLRIACVVSAGAVAGATAAAAAMSGVALIGAVAWWCSYVSMARSARHSTIVKINGAGGLNERD